MTPQQALLVKNSLRAAAPQRDRLEGFFLAELFARDPSLWQLFGREFAARGARLHEGLAAIVGSIDRLYPIVPVLEWLAFQGARHGLGERQFTTIGETLVAALESGQSSAFTPAHREAWTSAYRAVAGVMVRALEAEPLAA